MSFAKNKFVLGPVLALIGPIRLRELDVTDVDRVLTAIEATRRSTTVAMAHLALTRAKAKSQVLWNVSGLTDTREGCRHRSIAGRISQFASSLTRLHVTTSLCKC
jgi:hypothetical protein